MLGSQGAPHGHLTSFLPQAVWAHWSPRCGAGVCGAGACGAGEGAEGWEPGSQSQPPAESLLTPPQAHEGWSTKLFLFMRVSVGWPLSRQRVLSLEAILECAAHLLRTEDGRLNSS